MIDRLLPAAIVFLPLAALAWLLLRRTRPVMWFAIACLAVGIRTFWWEHERLWFGTGAGITWGSDPTGEWAETELKAARLVGLASAPAE